MRSQGILQRRVPPVFTWALVVLALTFVGESLQSRVHLNHDVSYFVHFARWLLQGRALGSDVLDMNLPMVWVVFTPSAALVQLGLLTEPSAVRLTMWIYFLVSTALMFRVQSGFDAPEKAAATGWKIAFVLVATLAPGFSFGQREHLSLLFAMPYTRHGRPSIAGNEGAGQGHCCVHRRACRHRVRPQAVFSSRSSTRRTVFNCATGMAIAA